MEYSIKFIKFISSYISLKADVSLLIFYLNDLSIDVSGVLKSPTIIVLLSISHFRSSNNYFLHVGSPKLGAFILTIFAFYYLFILKSILHDISIVTLSFRCHLLGLSSFIPSLSAYGCLQS